MRKKVIGFVMLICMMMVLLGTQKDAALADTKENHKHFTGEIGLLRQEEGQYILQVTVGNTGKDFSGKVQVVFANTEHDICAYNTQLVLPSQGEKQFTLAIPQEAAETVRGICAMNFLDEDGDILQTISLKNVFGNVTAGIPVGVLSDDFSSLGYMDLGGMDYYVQNTGYPLELIELNGDNLDGYLDGLYFLIIDQFDMSGLSDAQIEAIQDWVLDGGWLLIGTGAYANETLSGFDEDFLEVSVKNIYEPGEPNDIVDNNLMNGYYFSYSDCGVDFSKMTIAELIHRNQKLYYYESTENPAICAPLGEGAVSIYSISFADDEVRLLPTDQCYYMYQEVMYNSSSINNYQGFQDIDYMGQRALGVIDHNNTDVDFTWLKIVIAIYVVLVGPVLYFILRKCKKSDWYWLGVPALGLLFIGGVFLFGQGIRVNETKVYSVTVQQVDSSRMITQFMAYHSGLKEWKMRLNDSYDLAGPGYSGEYYGGTFNGDYHYVVEKDGDGMSIGMKPQENFETGYLRASGTGKDWGDISSKELEVDLLAGSFSGQVTNDTSRDMAYMAVVSADCVMVFSDVKARETLDIEQAVKKNRCIYQLQVQYPDEMMYNLMDLAQYGYTTGIINGDEYDKADMAALIIGIGERRMEIVDANSKAIVIGVVKDFEETVSSRCDEISYGCLYQIVDLEVNANAAY